MLWGKTRQWHSQFYPLNAGQKYYPGALIASDSEGLIDSGALLNLPNGEEHYSNIYELFVKHYKNNNLVVLDLGSSVVKIGEQSSINNFLGKILGVIDMRKTMLILHSPFYSSSSAVLGKKLTPIVITGSNFNRGLLFSSTTRRPGIIGNIDIAPSIASFYGGKINKSSGESTKIKEIDNNILKLTFLSDLTSFNSRSRGIVLKAYVTIQIILLVVSMLLMLLSDKKVLKRLLNLAIPFVLICPLTLLIMPVFRITEIVYFAFSAILMSVIITLILNKAFKQSKTRIILIAASTSLLLLMDILLQGNLNKTSLLGYDAVIGARYYGLGNEYMGILIATLLIAVVPLVKKNILKRWLGILILFSTLPVIGLSKYGANVGGTITALTTFCYIALYFYDKRLNWKAITLIIDVTVLMVLIFALYDIYLSPQKSHLAKTLIDIKANGLDVIRDIIYRKVSMNIKLLRWTIWSKVLLTSVVVMSVLFVKRSKFRGELFEKYNDFFGAWVGIIIASFIGMLVNDSGVVVAATANIFLIFSILYFVMEEKSDGLCRNWKDGH